MIIRQGALVVHDHPIYGQLLFDTEAIDAIGRATPSPARFFTLASTVTISYMHSHTGLRYQRTIPGDLAVVTPAEVDRVLRCEDAGISRGPIRLAWFPVADYRADHLVVPFGGDAAPSRPV